MRNCSYVPSCIFLSLSVLVLLMFIPQSSIAKTNVSYRLIRTIPQTKLQVDFLHTLRFFRRGLKIQFWRPADSVNRHVDVWVAAKSEEKLLGVLRSARLSFMRKVKDTHESRYLANVSMNNLESFDTKYHTYVEVVSEILRLATAFRDVAKLIKLGHSNDKNPVYGLEIRRAPKGKKNVIFINCGTHGREWLAISSCICTAREILFNYRYDNGLKELIDNYRIIIVPVLNPDGYIYSYKTDRYWRKSRSETHNENCIGVDINRNFYYRWGGTGSSADPCDETFSGPKPFSESETLILARYLYSIRDQLLSFIDVHTFGQLWMSPWGYTKANNQDFPTQKKVMNRISNAIKWTTGRTYKTGPASQMLYQTSGDSTDWAYGFLGVIHSYAVELRPDFGSGRVERFVRPAVEIKPTGKELLASIKELGNCLTDLQNSRL